MTVSDLDTGAVDLGDLTALRDWWTHDRNEEAAVAARLGETVRIVSSADVDTRVEANALAATTLNKDAASVTSLVTDPATGRVNYLDWMTVCDKSRHRINELRPYRNDPEGLYDQLPPGLAALCDDIMRAAQDPADRVLIDGDLAAALTLLAYEIDPDCLYRIRPLSRGHTTVETLVWDYLRLTPVLPLSTGLACDQLVPVAIELINAVNLPAEKTPRTGSAQLPLPPSDRER